MVGRIWYLIRGENMKSNWFKLTIICLLGLMALSVEAAFDQRHGAKGTW